VYAVHGSRLWLTTARRSVKARAWRLDSTVAGVVRAGRRAVALVGAARTHDLLDPSTWAASAAAAPTITAAAVAFTRRNARFFAGYAVDARRIPLAWTPPGRVFAEVTLRAAAVIEEHETVRRTWEWPGLGYRSRGAFRAVPSSGDALAGIPKDVRERVRGAGPAALAVEGRHGPVVLPVTWVSDRGAAYAVLSSEVLALAEAGPEAPAALTVDHASRWRARAMAGVLLQGTASIHVVGRLRSGSEAAIRLARRAGVLEEGPVVVRVTPERTVWWRGWVSDTVKPP
jgi:hypothetical protein